MISTSRSRLHFALAFIVLGSSAALMHAAQQRGWLRLVKKPLPIRKKLEDMDRNALAPLSFVGSHKLPPEVVEELGTEEYVNWILKEPSTEPFKGRAINLGITYYTGVVDQVPHVSEECMAQGAFTLDGDETVELKLESCGMTIPVRRQTFYPPRDLTMMTYVYYTFSSNGDFFATRNGVRRRNADLFDTHLYYSKIEISFKARPNADPVELDNAVSKTLDAVVSELFKSHWPKKGWERGGPKADEPVAATALPVGGNP